MGRVELGYEVYSGRYNSINSKFQVNLENQNGIKRPS